jgi:hypothetical protein
LKESYLPKFFSCDDPHYISPFDIALNNIIKNPNLKNRIHFRTDFNELIAMRVLHEYPNVPDDVGERLVQNYLEELEKAMFERNDIQLYNER